MYKEHVGEGENFDFQSVSGEVRCDVIIMSHESVSRQGVVTQVWAGEMKKGLGLGLLTLYKYVTGVVSQV